METFISSNSSYDFCWMHTVIGCLLTIWLFSELVLIFYKLIKWIRTPKITEIDIVDDYEVMDTESMDECLYSEEE